MVLFVSAVGCIAEVIRVEGALTYTAYKQENQPVAIAKKRFICRFEGCKWSVIVSNVWPKATNITTLYYESASLGGDVFSLEVRSGDTFTKHLAEARARGVPRTLLFSDMAIINSGPVPYCSPSEHLGPIWFAYCCSCLPKVTGELGMKPIWWTAPELLKDTNYLVQAYVTGFPENPLLPSCAVFVSDGRAYHPKTRVLSLRPGPYGLGFTNAIFEASDLVKVGETFVPKLFQLALFRPRPGGTNRNELWVGAKWKGVAESIAIDHSRELALPRILTNTFVHDYRTAMAILPSRVEYGITNGRWIAPDEPAFKKAEVLTVRQYQRFKSSSALASRDRSFVHVSLIGFLLVSTLLLAFVVVKVKRPSFKTKRERTIQ